MDSLNTSSVAIDGLAVRKIREEKRLTQFYVSKVVGVTTDTVSRWENNRYPTIMRDNALKLAEALEVELDDILKKESEIEDSESTEDTAVTTRRSWLPLLGILVLFVVVVGYLVLQPTAEPEVVLHAKRILPAYAAPGSQVLIRVELSSDKPLKGMILKEVFPAGWKLAGAQPAVSHLDGDAGKARWIFRKPSLTTHVFYLLKVPEKAHSGDVFTLHGELIANPDGQRSATPVASVNTMEIEPFHWADSNGDGVIDDLEILDVSDLTDEAESLDLDWDLIESIWEMGAYQWQVDQKKFIPIEPPSEQ